VPERATINALRGPSSAHAHGEKLTRRYGVAIGVSDASCLVAVRCGFGCRMRCCVHPCQRAHPSPPHASVTLLFGHDPLAGPRPSTQEKQKEPRVCLCVQSAACVLRSVESSALSVWAVAGPHTAVTVTLHTGAVAKLQNFAQCKQEKTSPLLPLSKKPYTVKSRICDEKSNTLSGKPKNLLVFHEFRV
jgi:hypothetical protein